MVAAAANQTVSEVGTVLAANFSDSTFEEKFNRKKPTNVSALIFTCRIGVRSNTAAVQAIGLGYDK